MFSFIHYMKLAIYVAGASLVLAACSGEEANNAAPSQPLPSVIIAPVSTKDVSSSVVFVGQAQAFQRVEFRARVAGILEERSFVEGASINQGDVLFGIEKAEYLAARQRAQANLESALATQLEADEQLKRYQVLQERGTASEASLDEAKAVAARAAASVSGAKAELAQVELNLEYTQIRSPISGVIGRSTVDVGNLIGPDSGVLATIVDIDPIQVVFSVSEKSFLEFKREQQKSGKIREVTPRLKLADGSMYQHPGEINFVSNEVDSTTGTIQVRVDFPNPDGFVLPGQYVNVILIAKDPEQQVVVPQAAVQTNQSGPFVLTVNGENTVGIRKISTGQLVGTEIVVTDGLSAGETIIIEGIQKVRPGAKVNPVMQNATSAS